MVYESFQFRSGLPKAVLTPVEVIGVVKEWARQKDWALVSQTPAEGKFFFTDDRLKAMQLWKPGKPHAMDALRHLLYFRKEFVAAKEAEEENRLRRQNYEQSLYK